MTSLPPVSLLALARLLVAADKGETEKNVSKDLKPLAEHRWDGAAWADRLGEALAALESRGAVGRVRVGKTVRLALTDDGRRLALEALGVDALPAKTTWAKLRTALLPALALGRRGAAGVDLKAEILRSRYGLELGDRPKLAEAADATAAKLLGLEPGRKFTAEAILRKLLQDVGIDIPAGQKPSPTTIREALFRRELGDPSARKPLELLASRGVGARQGTPAELSAAVLRSWIDRGETSDGPVPVPVPASAAPAPLDLTGFARRVAEAARGSRDGRFGDGKVFISHVWRVLRTDPAFRAIDAADFKARLVEAHRAGLLDLGRADLVDAMDPADVRESATPYLNAVYHFVRIEE